MVKIIKKYDDGSPSEDEVRAMLEGEGLKIDSWSAEAGTVTEPQVLNHNRAVVVVSGMLRVTLPDDSQEFADLMGGDRIDIPAGTKHGMMVGPAGTKAVEGK